MKKEFPSPDPDTPPVTTDKPPEIPRASRLARAVAAAAAAPPGPPTLESVSLEARTLLGDLLRQFIKIGLPETDLNRLHLENAYEQVRGEITKHHFTPDALTAAAKECHVALTILANNSRVLSEDLTAFRAADGTLAKHLAAVLPTEEPESP